MVDCFFEPACIRRAVAMVDLAFPEAQDEMVPLCQHHIDFYQRDPNVTVREIVALPI